MVEFAIPFNCIWHSYNSNKSRSECVDPASSRRGNELVVSYHNHFGGESIGNYLWLCETMLCPSRDGAQLLGSCANWLLWRGNSRPRYVGDAPWRSTPPIAREPIDQIGSGSLHRLRERAIDDEVGSGVPAVDRPRDEHKAGGNFLRHAHSSRWIQGDRRLESLRRNAFDALPDAPWNKYFAASRQSPARRGTAVSSRAPCRLPAVAFARKSYPPSLPAFPDKTIIPLYRPSLRCPARGALRIE